MYVSLCSFSFLSVSVCTYLFASFRVFTLRSSIVFFVSWYSFSDHKSIQIPFQKPPASIHKYFKIKVWRRSVRGRFLSSRRTAFGQPLGPSWKHLGGILGASRAVQGGPGSVSERLRGVLRVSRGHLEACCCWELQVLKFVLSA